jgi:hypothetical protein
MVDKSTGGEVANALVCKTSIHGFKSHPVLQIASQPILRVMKASQRVQCNSIWLPALTASL